MWRIGVDYLLECDDEGRENIALLIGRMPIDNEKTAIALNAICLRASLRRIAADVAESMTYRCVAG
ncbi:unnamed protein product [Anisakis simplex]|uniref:Nuclear pore complex protein Nup85 n=1 Tax=Anisakis simplex TaxID=6269 RepID=A0A0M3JMU2_ANISI|nr:unnamed protein product [Anisakis simplex]